MASSKTERDHYAEFGHCRICGNRKEWVDRLKTENEQLQAELIGAKEDIRRLMYVPADIVAENKLLRAIAEQARNYILYKQGTAKVVTDNIKKALVKAVGEAVK